MESRGGVNVNKKQNGSVGLKGSKFWNLFYPGHVHLPENSAYFCKESGRNCIAVVVRHLDALVITDFNNHLIERKVDDKVFVEPERSIQSDPANTLSVEFFAKGNSQGKFAVWTRDHYYKIYREQCFTEITIGCEVDNYYDDEGIEFFHRLFDRFIMLYRVVASDPSAASISSIKHNVPVIRTARFQYPENLSELPPFERLRRSIPPVFEIFKQLSVFEFAEHASRLQVDRMNIATRVGHHFTVGTTISEGRQALSECYEALHRLRNYRYAVIDAFSVIEVEAFSFFDDSSRLPGDIRSRFNKKKTKRGVVSIKDVIHSFLPQILEVDLARFPKLIGDLDRSRILRHDAVHERSKMGASETEFVMNTASSFLIASESWRNRMGK